MAVGDFTCKHTWNQQPVTAGTGGSCSGTQSFLKLNESTQHNDSWLHLDLIISLLHYKWMGERSFRVGAHRVTDPIIGIPHLGRYF